MTVDHDTWQAQRFEEHRAELQAVAYRMLGSVTEAEDAVQEAWLRLSRSRDGAIENLGAWLTTVVGRVCIDMLRARRSRREEAAGTWLPEPIVTADGAAGDPERETLLADSVGLALLVVLETLSPPERLAYVLHDMFAVPFDDIARIVDRTPESARQLASRARRRIRGAAPQPAADPAEQRQVVEAFLAASRAGDFDALLAVLDPDVVFRADAGGRAGLVTPVITGAAEVAQFTSVQGPRFAPRCRLAMVNGAPGLMVRTAGGPLSVAAFTVTGGRITTIDLVIGPEKLRGVAADA